MRPDLNGQLYSPRPVTPGVIRWNDMTFASKMIVIGTIAICGATQAFPLFPFGPPPLRGGKINFFGWPCLAVTSVANCDASGKITEHTDLHPRGIAINLVAIVILGVGLSCGLQRCVSKPMFTFSILDLLALTASLAVVLAFFDLVPKIVKPIATLGDSQSAFTYYTTDRALYFNTICSALLGLGTYGLICLTTVRHRNNKDGG